MHCLESVHMNKQALKLLAIDEQVQDILKKSSHIKQNILNDVFWDKVQGLLRLLKPIANAITVSESDTPSMSKVIKIFMDLQKHFSECVPVSPLNKAEEKEAVAILARRKGFAVCDVHKAANLLDPSLCGADLSPEEQVLYLYIVLLSHCCFIFPTLAVH